MAQPSSPPQHSHAYSLFILVLTVFSLLIMVGLVLPLPLSDQTIQLLMVYDNAICVVFLFDFFLSLTHAPNKREYFFRERGWLDLIGSIPSLGFFKYTALLRLARLSRLARITRLLRTDARRELIADVVKNRANYAAFVTIMLAFIVLTVASTLVLQFESHSPDANITTGGDALWWAVVTITTVGYGDRYPVTAGGRVTAVFVMFAGVGIIGALASILASILVPAPAQEPALEADAPPTPVVENELAAMRTELAAIRQALEKLESP
jgi:voltage-gated potassium channel